MLPVTFLLDFLHNSLVVALGLAGIGVSEVGIDADGVLRVHVLFSQVLFNDFLFIFVTTAFLFFVVFDVGGIGFSGETGDNGRENASSADGDFMGFEVAALDKEDFVDEIGVARTEFDGELELLLA